MGEQVPLKEIVLAGAADTLFYGRHFFPQALRQSSPPMHRDVVTAVEMRNQRRVAIKMHRGAAKTTLVRVITSKRIAYGLSRTIMVVSETQEHAIKTVKWIRRQVTHNKRWAETFKITPAKSGTSSKPEKWSDEQITLHNGVMDINITIIAAGITGQTRGVNIDDYRPDFIIVDDPCDEENTATPEQRGKIEKLFFGALEKSLTPATENPDAKIVLLQTPLHREDLIETAMRDKSWLSLEFGCFDEHGQSRWPERFTTEELLEDKQAHIDRGQLSLWLREMEVRVVNEELTAFNAGWLQYWDVLPEQHEIVYALAIDPTPPPKDSQQNSANTKLDDTCILVLGLWKGRRFVADYYTTKSPNPDELTNKIFEMVMTWRPLVVGFESVLFARTQKHLIEKEMQKRGQFFTLRGVEDKRKKSIRIRHAITPVASQRMLYVHSSQTALIEQFSSYPDVGHDDILDALSIAIELTDEIGGVTLEGEYWEDEEDDYPSLDWRGAP